MVFWIAVLFGIIGGFAIRGFGVRTGFLYLYLLVLSCAIISGIETFSFQVLIVFVIISIFLDTLPISIVFNCVTKLGFLVLVKSLFINDVIQFLPLGISFVVFQAISFSVDKRVLKSSPSTLSITTYLLMFPQVFAGPIIKFKDFFTQAENIFRPTKDYIQYGIVMLLVGLSYKAVISNEIAPVVNQQFSSVQDLNFVSLYLSSILFGVQIYSDFLAYSLIALGLCRIIGFSFPENFNFPYLVFLSVTFGDVGIYLLGAFYTNISICLCNRP